MAPYGCGVALARQPTWRCSGVASARCGPGTSRAFAGRSKEEGKSKEEGAQEIEAHIREQRAISRHIFKDKVVSELSHAGVSEEKLKRLAARKFQSDWRSDPGHQVPARFKLEPPAKQKKARRPAPEQAQDAGGDKPKEQNAGKSARKDSYTDFAGLRFPTLETAGSFDYHQDRGLKRIKERSFPITVPGHRRLDPYLREYIHFLHNLDPARFTVERIAERYRLRTKTVKKVIQEWGTNRFLLGSGLVQRLRDKQMTREAVVLNAKEQQYGKWVGFDQMGDEDDQESDDELVGEFRGWRSTSDWLRRQTVEVEMMSAFPMMEKREPMPKRVDVDLVVENSREHKIINWIDPNDKVVF